MKNLLEEKIIMYLKLSFQNLSGPEQWASRKCGEFSFNMVSSKISLTSQENPGISSKFVSITFAQYCSSPCPSGISWSCSSQVPTTTVHGGTSNRAPAPPPQAPALCPSCPTGTRICARELLQVVVIVEWYW